MENIKNIKSCISFLAIGLLIGILSSLLPINSFAQVGMIIGFIAGLAILFYLGYIYDLGRSSVSVVSYIWVDESPC